MELKYYLSILLKRWWLILLAMIVTLVPTIMLVSQQPWVYTAEATFVIRPRASFAENEEEFVDAVDTLSRRVEINTTFAEVASSNLIKQRAIKALDLSSNERRGLKVNGDVIAGTNILKISVEGRDPNIVSTFANAASKETVAYVSGLYDVFELESLDEATIPKRPSGPNKTVTIILGAIFGLILGVGLVFLIEYLHEPLPGENVFNILDSETGVFNRAYFLLRLQEEISRARHNNNTFSLALIRLEEHDLVNSSTKPMMPDRAVSHIITTLGSNLRGEDTLAYLGDSTFALLLPDLTEDSSQALLADLPRLNEDKPLNVGKDMGTTLVGTTGVIEYQSDEETVDQLLDRATIGLEESRRGAQVSVTHYKNISLVSNGRNGGHRQQASRQTAAMSKKSRGNEVVDGDRKCPHCKQSKKQVKAGLTSAGNQRYLYKECQSRYTLGSKPRAAGV